MEWFDGTYDTSIEELIVHYPVKITDSLRLSEDKRKLVIINNIEEGSLYYNISHPNFQLTPIKRKNYIFYHIIVGEVAKTIEKAINDFCLNWDKSDGSSILLVRQDKDKIYSYSNGFICINKFIQQDNLKYSLLDSSDWDKETLIIPLKLYFYKCPICKHRTLSYRYRYDICAECGWEDFGDSPENVINFCSPNGSISIRAYRKRYKKIKQNNPNFTWAGLFKNNEDCI